MAWGIVPDWKLPHGVYARVTTVNEPGNLAVHVGDDPATVVRNRRQLQRQLALPTTPKWLTQVHGTEAVCFEQSSSGVVADAIWSQTTPSVCAVLTADCLPILVVSDDGEVIAAIHAGWRGLVAGIVERTIQSLPSPANKLNAYIGPAISRSCFEVGNEVHAAFAARGWADSSTFFPNTNDKWHADLPLLAQRALIDCGVVRITQSGLCSYRDPRFSSHRRNPDSGRIASLIWKVA